MTAALDFISRLLSMMRPLHLILLLIPIGVAFRYCVELTQAARVIEIAISSPADLSVNNNGLTPPESNKWFFLTMARRLVGRMAVVGVRLGDSHFTRAVQGGDGSVQRWAS